MVRDTTADYSDVKMHAALDVNMPTYASAFVTAELMAYLRTTIDFPGGPLSF
jgi:hypothetical protein